MYPKVDGVGSATLFVNFAFDFVIVNLIMNSVESLTFDSNNNLSLHAAGIRWDLCLSRKLLNFVMPFRTSELEKVKLVEAKKDKTYKMSLYKTVFN